MGLGIDFSANSIKIVAVKRKLGGFKLTGALQYTLIGLDDNEIDKTIYYAIKEALDNWGTDSTYIGITGKDVNLQLIQLPAVKPYMFRKMMKFELEQKVGPAGDLYADYCVLREPDSMYRQYYAIIGLAKKDYIDNRIRKLEEVGLSIKEIVPNSFGIYNAYMNSVEPSSETVLIVDIGADNTELIIIRASQLLFARNISAGSKIFNENIQRMTNATYIESEILKIEKAGLIMEDKGESKDIENIYPAIRSAAGQYTNMLQSSIMFAKNQLKEEGLNINKILLSGGGAKLKGLKEYLQNSLNMPVEYFDPYKNVDINLDSEAETNLRNLPTAMVSALGLAEMSAAPLKTPTLSILPQPLKKKRNFFKSTLFLYISVTLLVITMAFLTIVALIKRNTQQNELNSFLNETQEIEGKVKHFNEIMVSQRELANKVKTLTSEISTGRMSVDIVDKLSKILPVGMWLKGLSEEEIDGKGTLIISGFIDDGIKGGVDNVLKEIENQLKDPTRGINAKIEDLRESTERKGWKSFIIHIR